jgi:hypothetical protein
VQYLLRLGIQAPTKQETQLTIEKLSNNNALGTGGIPAKLRGHGGQEVINKIQKLMGIMCEKESIQEEWKLSIICPIHQKGASSTARLQRHIIALYSLHNFHHHSEE